MMWFILVWMLIFSAVVVGMLFRLAHHDAKMVELWTSEMRRQQLDKLRSDAASSDVPAPTAPATKHSEPIA